MSLSKPDAIEDFVRLRGALIERKRQLIEEISRIDEALKPPPAKPRTHRRGDSNAGRVEAFVRSNPGSSAKTITEALKIDQNRVSTALTSLARTGRVTRTRADKVWIYSVLPLDTRNGEIA